MAPFPIEEIFSHAGANFIYLLIGIAFGAVLEIAGFGNSPKLAAQFYFKDQTVLKVMFTSILVAMTLIAWATGLGLLDIHRVWVNPTYLWPGIVGGLIMGFGFIIGGFCPGTSLVAVGTLKVDGILFSLGVLFGIFTFGETIDQFSEFWNSSYMGRFTVPEWLGLSTGATVLLIISVALFMFWGAEQLERIFGGKSSSQSPKIQMIGAATLVVAALGLVGLGQPTALDKWQQIAAAKEPLLTHREVQIHPGELLGLMNNDQINLVMFDVRNETDYNLFHIMDAQLQSVNQVEGLVNQVEGLVPTLLDEPANTIIVLMDNNESRSTEAWKILMANSVPNVYILEGGVNCWLDIFGHEKRQSCSTETASADGLRYTFKAALGSNQESAEPEKKVYEGLKYTPKVKLQEKKAAKGGGCG